MKREISTKTAIAGVVAAIMLIVALFVVKSKTAGAGGSSVAPSSVTTQLQQFGGGNGKTAPDKGSDVRYSLPMGMTSPGNTGGGPPMIMSPSGGGR